MRVLLIENNTDDVALVRRACSGGVPPVDLEVKQDGDEALDFLFQRALHDPALMPDLIILDLRFPKKTGFEILAALEQDSELKFLPVVVLAGSSKKTDVNRCYELGANAYVIKPADPAQYIALVQTIIQFWHGCQFRELSHKRSGEH
jgi:CheY-like chemotaxis protein